ncbi:MAG: TolC family protein, partial [Gammaproteobacteria bacterium]|nr:TolC family protein [Gammaproteobacteria bacterium]
MTRLRLSISLILLTAASAEAQEGLLEIYERALVNDPVVREAEANFLATAEVKAQARSGILPSLQFGSSFSDSHSENPDPPLDFFTGEPSTVFSSTESDSESTSLSLSLNQTVFDWGTFLSLKQADKTVARAEIDLAAVRQELLIRVAEAYFNVLAAEDSLASEIAARESIARQLEQAQRRNEVGLDPITVVQEAQAGYDQAVAAVIAAERVLATAQEVLREIIDDYVVDLKSPVEELPLIRPNP